ncbi:intein-containing Rv2578c family radical SAM protein [Nesterenkonia halotolerans]|uniref:DNA repair photolyase n=1 Tax=Nesterenkonia halotolerans TaxID=225325 RepID=A0ABR9J3X4_9MICC|nr:intein-containing Rv2578c family radical SAM protein [Nesterenkonia halotolerans]MBE1513296.1 DNA repair photolyase [Nesterenkonia halotolerans]
MRWQGQAVQESDGAALIPLKGLMRSVRTPEFEGVTFHEVAAKTALNKVPGQSNMPFSWTVNPTRGCLHQCVYCLSPETLILMANGRQKLLREVAVGDRVVGTQLDGKYRRFVESEVQAKWGTEKPAFRVTLRDGTEIVASGDHRFLTDRGWKYVTSPESSTERSGQRPYLTVNNRMMGFGLGMAPEAYEAPRETDQYRRGYLTGMIRGDGMLVDRTYLRSSTGKPYRVTIFRLALKDEQALIRSKEYLELEGIGTVLKPYVTAGLTRPMQAIYTSTRANHRAITEMIEWPDDPCLEWRKGYLAGFFDAEGSYSQGALRFTNSDAKMLSHGHAALEALDLDGVVEPANARGIAALRIRGGRAAHRRFFHSVAPSIDRKLNILGGALKSSSDLGVTSIEPLDGVQKLIDITTSTGDFIANGVVSHNCFARKTHEYLDLDAGRDFDTQIIVKTNVAQVLRAELNRHSWKREHVALGTNTDPYQRAEGRYQLMPGIIRALADSGTPFSILTKGPLLKRDLPLLQEAAQQVPVSVAVSLAVLDPELQQKVEPGTPDPRARLNLIRSITDAGLDCSVLAMPILPWLTDGDERINALHAALAEAGASYVTTGALHLRPGAREWFMQWLAREYPGLLGKYRRIYGGGSYASKDYRHWLADSARAARRRHGFDKPTDLMWRERSDPDSTLSEALGSGQGALDAASAPAQPALF